MIRFAITKNVSIFFHFSCFWITNFPVLKILWKVERNNTHHQSGLLCSCAETLLPVAGFRVIKQMTHNAICWQKLTTTQTLLHISSQNESIVDIFHSSTIIYLLSLYELLNFISFTCYTYFVYIVFPSLYYTLCSVYKISKTIKLRRELRRTTQLWKKLEDCQTTVYFGYFFRIQSWETSRKIPAFTEPLVAKSMWYHGMVSFWGNLK